MNGSGYTIVQAGAEVPAEEFVRRYVDLKDPAAGCRPCPDYGRYWTCPPYDVPAAEYWGRYETVLLRGMQFHFTRELLERRFKRWANPAQMVARGLAPYERDLKDLRAWKKEALDRANESRKGIQESQAADARAPLVATMTARWPYARELHDVELTLDFRSAVPRLDVRYEATLGSPNGRTHEL